MREAAALPEAQGRTELMEAVCSGLGDALYPAFVNLLCHIERQGEPAVQVLVADALGSWSRSARQGVLALADAWEAGAPADDVAARCLAALNGRSPLGRLRADLPG